MSHCTPLSFETTDAYRLDGLWFGPQNARRGFIFVHGLGSSVMQHHELLLPLVDDMTALLFFSNRGHDKIGNVKKLLPDTEKGYQTENIGEAHEVFADCVHDIQGAVTLLKKAGVQEIYLVGHSTGCQKSVYYAAQGSPDIKGVVLLCPLSDYAYAAANEDPDTMAKATAHARKLVADGKPHELLPLELSEDLLDAQRYLSLYTPDSIEEIFPYSQPDAKPVTFQAVTLPVLAVFAEADEYADRPAADIAAWFKQHGKNVKTGIISSSLHNLNGHGEQVTDLIRDWRT